MPENSLKSAQMEGGYKGKLQINVTSSLGLIPIPDATVTISYRGTPDTAVEKLTTDSSGQTEAVELVAPPLEYSVEPSDEMPYSEYNIQVEAPGYETVLVSGTEILPDVTAVQPIEMIPEETAREEEELIVIPGHTLYEEYPPKIPEDEIKPMDESGEIVLSRVVIPEFIVVGLRLGYRKIIFRRAGSGLFVFCLFFFDHRKIFGRSPSLVRQQPCQRLQDILRLECVRRIRIHSIRCIHSILSIHRNPSFCHQ